MHTTSTLCFIFPLAVAACSNDASPTGTTSGPVASSSAQAITSTAPSAVVVASAASSASSSGPEPESSAVVDAGVKHDAGAHHKDAGAASTPSDAGALAVEDAGPTRSLSLGTPDPGSADEVAAKVDELFVDKKTFKASFKQEYIVKVSNTTKKSTGTVLVQKPDRISFRYDAPNQNRIVSDGLLLKVYVADDTQMFTQPVQKTEYPGALAFIMGHGLRPSFTFTFNDKAKFDGPVLVGTPRQPTPSYQSVLFYVDKALLEKKDPGVIRRVLILDAQGNKNRFDFDSASQPASIDASEFVFSPPAGTTITQN